MNQFLSLPERPEKPRSIGITNLLDNGVPMRFFRDVVESHCEYIDLIKFGWGTSLVTKDLQKKIEICLSNNIFYYFGGTLFEKAYVQKNIDGFLKFCESQKVEYIEISDGTIEIPMADRMNLIKDFKKNFRVMTEVGYKDHIRSQELNPSKWIEYMRNDFEAGAEKVITEARESGTSGICRSNGEVRYGLVEEILNSDLNISDVIFEAPNKTLQTYFLQKVGSNVNLGNISFHDVIGLETLRLGLRSDTLTLFEGKTKEEVVI